MGTAAFQPAIDRGEPLADVSITFREGVDYVAATASINSLTEDFDLHPPPYYDNPRWRIGTSTKPALERLFGWRIERAKPPGYPCYIWVEIAPPARYPPGLEKLIENMGLSQPGADDDGQPYEWPVRGSRTHEMGDSARLKRGPD